MEQDVTLKAFLKEILEPIIDECLERAMNKYINSMVLEPKEESDIMDRNEAAQYLKLSNATLYGMTCKRTIPFYKHGHKLYFKKSELEKWLSQGRVKTRDEITEEVSPILAPRRRKW